MIAVVKYNAGNIFSVMNALGRLGVEAVLTDDADLLRRADGVVFPGQGEASGAMSIALTSGRTSVGDTRLSGSYSAGDRVALVTCAIGDCGVRHTSEQLTFSGSNFTRVCPRCD